MHIGGSLSGAFPVHSDGSESGVNAQWWHGLRCLIVVAMVLSRYFPGTQCWLWTEYLPGVH